MIFCFSIACGESQEKGADSSREQRQKDRGGTEDPSPLRTPRSATAQATSSGARERVDGLLYVPAGAFTMGCVVQAQDYMCERDERPQRRVNTNAYRIHRTEVTVGAYRDCVASGVCDARNTVTQSNLGGEQAACNWRRQGVDAHPMNCVTWKEASTYCRWRGMRLPTEVEWEKAARGTDGRAFPWGNERVFEGRVVKLRLSATEPVGGPNHTNSTWPVGQFPRGSSPYGACDMLGNVWEWTASPYPHEADEVASTQRVVRGNPDWRFMRVSERIGLAPDVRSGLIGFRCADSGVR